MPRKRKIHREGINTSGNEYTVYNDGSYRYKNVNYETGKTSSSYFDTNNGHSFFKKNGPDGYNFHENQNQGFRNYSSNAKPVAQAQGMNSHGNAFQFYDDNSYRFNNKNHETGKGSSNFYNDGNGNAKSGRRGGNSSYQESQGSWDKNPNIVIIVNGK